jgi:hypothetical protein
MLNRFRQMFGKPEPKLSDESRAFISNLAKGDIWILAVGLRGVPVIPNVTDPAAWDIIAAHRIDVAEIGDDDAVLPFNCERDGRQIFPFFSSEERARHFRTDSGFQVDLSPFQPYRLLAGFVATPENDMLELVLDLRSPFEKILNRDERLLLRSLTTSA